MSLLPVLQAPPLFQAKPLQSSIPSRSSCNSRWLQRCRSIQAAMAIRGNASQPRDELVLYKTKLVTLGLGLCESERLACQQLYDGRCGP